MRSADAPCGSSNDAFAFTRFSMAYLLSFCASIVQVLKLTPMGVSPKLLSPSPPQAASRKNPTLVKYCNPVRIYLCKNNTTQHHSIEAPVIGLQERLHRPLFYSICFRS